MEERVIYLYLKESPLGLKYLGKTVKDPFKYTGSGNRWLNHLKFHNIRCCDLKTEIIFHSTKIEEIKEKGLYYSKLWDIVNSDKFANLTPESGEGTFGYKHSKETIKKLKNKKASQETRDKISKAKLGVKRPEIAKKLSKPIIHKSSGIVYNSIREAAKIID